MLRKIAAVLILAVLLLVSPARAVQSFIEAGGMTLTSGNQTTVLDQEWTVTSESDSFFILVNLVVQNQSNRAVQLTVTLAEASTAFANQVKVFNVESGAGPFTYQLPFSVTALTAGPYTAQVKVTSAAPNQLILTDASYLGIFNPVLASGAIGSLNGATGSSQTFAIGYTADGDGRPNWVTASNVHTLHLPLASSTAYGILSTGTQSLNGAKTFLVSPGTPGSGSNSCRLGTSATASGSASVAIGNSALVGASAAGGTAVGYLSEVQGAASTAVGNLAKDNTLANCVAVGAGAECQTGNGGVAVGHGALAATGSVAIGDGALGNAGGTHAVCIGEAAQCGGTYGIGIGANAVPSTGICLGRDCTGAANTFSIGGASQSITTVRFGKGLTASSVSTVTLKPTKPTGTNVRGADLSIGGSEGTGTGQGGDINMIFCAAGASGSSSNTCNTGFDFDGQTGTLEGPSMDIGTAAAPLDDVYARSLYLGVNGQLNSATSSGNVLYDSTITSTTNRHNVVGGVILRDGLRLDPAAQAITAVGNTITGPDGVGSTGATVRSLTADATYTLTAAPTIADGTAGDVLILRNDDSGSDCVTVQDQGTLASSNLRLAANTRQLCPRDALGLYFDGSDWTELFFTNVL